MAKPSTFNRTTAELLHDKLNSDERPVLINALAKEAYMAKRIPGSINVPAEHPEWIDDIVPDKDEDIVVYCANTDCPASPNLAESLIDRGYTRVWDYEEGLAGWENTGHKLVGNDVNS
ncbi:MAG TPA: rhodanese-like domain-containing protein [Fodinibius sp.]|nr:rhodanese-like domain-containing protein [Fodinibius sp.]